MNIKTLLQKEIYEICNDYSGYLGENIAYSDIKYDDENMYKLIDVYNSFVDWFDFILPTTDDTFSSSFVDDQLLYVVDNVYDSLSDSDKIKLVKSYKGEIPNAENEHAWFNFEDYDNIKSDIDKQAYSIVIDMYNTYLDDILEKAYRKYKPKIKREYKSTKRLMDA